MLLVIDVGNTNMVLGVYESDKLMATWRITTSNSRTADEIGIFIHSLFDNSEISASLVTDAIISSVVPNIMYSLTHGIRKYFGIDPIVVEPGLKTGINLKMENPKELGADRLVNMVAAHELYKGDLIVIDYGTATTFDVINAKGEFLTGITAPGIQVCAEALFLKAAQIPKVEIKNPGGIIAKNTVTSLQAGILFGHIGETLYIVGRIKKDLPEYGFKVVATGGLARTFEEVEHMFDFLDPVLTLQGLRIIFEKNKRVQKKD